MENRPDLSGGLPVLQEDMVATKVDVAITSLGSMKEAVVQHSATKCDNISSC